MTNTPLRYAQLKLENNPTHANCFVRWFAELVIASGLGSIEAMNEDQQDRGALTVAIAGTEYEVTITRK